VGAWPSATPSSPCGACCRATLRRRGHTRRGWCHRSTRLPAPDGTCYCADDPVGALLERHIDPDALDPIVDVADLATSAVWTCVPPTEFDAADLTSRAAPVTKELSTVTPYDVEGGPGEWADAIAANGWHGLVAWTRLDPAGSRTVALFSNAGTGTPDGWGGPAEMGLGGNWAG
jgi:hypothetical protein